MKVISFVIYCTILTRQHLESVKQLCEEEVVGQFTLRVERNVLVLSVGSFESLPANPLDRACRVTKPSNAFNSESASAIRCLPLRIRERDLTALVQVLQVLLEHVI